MRRIAVYNFCSTSEVLLTPLIFLSPSPFAGALLLVDRTPWRWLRMWPLWVSYDSGKCLLKFFTVMRGQAR